MAGGGPDSVDGPVGGRASAGGAAGGWGGQRRGPAADSADARRGCGGGGVHPRRPGRRAEGELGMAEPGPGGGTAVRADLRQLTRATGRPIRWPAYSVAGLFGGGNPNDQY